MFQLIHFNTRHISDLKKKKKKKKNHPVPIFFRFRLSQITFSFRSRSTLLRCKDYDSQVMYISCLLIYLLIHINSRSLYLSLSLIHTYLFLLGYPQKQVRLKERLWKLCIALSTDATSSPTILMTGGRVPWNARSLHQVLLTVLPGTPSLLTSIDAPSRTLVSCVMCVCVCVCVCVC